ncbi:hypothetical protein DFA_08897 [Cavenderia fasciculata]|uniref:Transmembrane protein n=1 Tax=Cavenderia fasciculata TaxID=261658 RepID=F4Q4V0_CACFS|nr:uncharacterized protein DFA_08897 [Cavenderia fasciculata]EGG17896.1 hypothetical protein DFA_08897 [Cavenderia fasciculata]|eukprot:XP_004356380.1 hypothetical protein DFA_08897 [Cavenderia fasciculata]
MFKVFIVLIFILISTVVHSYEISKVTQNGKTQSITFEPTSMIWMQNQIQYQGMSTDIQPFCSQGASPMICNLPAIPQCDTIKLRGTVAIGTTNLNFIRSFNCTVAA